MNLKSKYTIPIIATVGTLSLIGGMLYYQYTRLMKYCLSFNNIKINALNASAINFDLVLKIVNKSDIKIQILSQKYSAYINGNIITNVQSNNAQTINPTDASLLALNVVINPKDILKAAKGVTISDILFNQQNINIKIDLKIKVALFFFKINIPFTYEATLKDIMNNRAGKTASKGKC